MNKLHNSYFVVFVILVNFAKFVNLYLYIYYIYTYRRTVVLCNSQIKPKPPWRLVLLGCLRRDANRAAPWTGARKIDTQVNPKSDKTYQQVEPRVTKSENWANAKQLWANSEPKVNIYKIDKITKYTKLPKYELWDFYTL